MMRNINYYLLNKYLILKFKVENYLKVGRSCLDT